MARNLWRSKERMNSATSEQKTQSKFQRQKNQYKIMLKTLSIKNKLRLIQNRRDHQFIYLFKDRFKKEYEECITLYLKKYGTEKKLDFIKSEMEQGKYK